MNRRNALKLVGGGVVLAAGGAGAFAMTRTPTKALAPWTQAGQYVDPRLHALSYAILAPNPHNQQPWIVELEGDDAFSLYFNHDQDLPHTDPFDRQLTIGLGSFLELGRMAAAADGYRMDTTLFPFGEDEAGLDDRPIARVEFVSDDSLAPDPLWAHVMDRRSNKEPYDTNRAVPQSALDDVLSVGLDGTRLGGSVETQDIDFWRDLTEKALDIEFTTERTLKESVDVFRIGKREVNANPDGIDLNSPMFDALYATGLLTREATMDPSSMAYQGGMSAYQANCRSAMGHVWMVTPGNSRIDQITAGRDWLRVNLAATRAGLGFQPMSQALQEYPEMTALHDEVHARLAPEGGTVQMLARIGYGPEVAPSPRWPIDAKVRSV